MCMDELYYRTAYSDGEQSRIPRVPWLAPTPLSNLDCFGPIRLPLVYNEERQRRVPDSAVEGPTP
jgi:hypothetical protein